MPRRSRIYIDGVQKHSFNTATTASPASSPMHWLSEALHKEHCALHAYALMALFRTQLDGKAINDIRVAFNQSQPSGNERFYQYIEQMTGQRRESQPRGRPRIKQTGIIRTLVWRDFEPL
jgi:hypothetical protein